MNQFTKSGDKLAQQLISLGIKNKKVLDAISSVPRHLFVHYKYQVAAIYA